MAKVKQSQHVESEDPDKTGNGEMQWKTESREMNRWAGKNGNRKLLSPLNESTQFWRN
jgi:hypothetical protein